ncbi:hypothetical protein BV25DRAFT_1918959 [Artomyces pyxidatus]|uniref:Uncharacterized protein n=1 Tax=Artomyces pyxidatus TaxID=48021 RepID=A0ACB8ST17_9AGAM|nr:hypothetical protein BV25DRAFT_1918959 [Artomyces pyxidatus]
MKPIRAFLRHSAAIPFIALWGSHAGDLMPLDETYVLACKRRGRAKTPAEFSHGGRVRGEKKQDPARGVLEASFSNRMASDNQHAFIIWLTHLSYRSSILGRKRWGAVALGSRAWCLRDVDRRPSEAYSEGTQRLHATTPNGAQREEQPSSNALAYTLSSSSPHNPSSNMKLISLFLAAFAGMAFIAVCTNPE